MKPKRCPICDTPLGDDTRAFHPFCSKRCKLLDLSRWLSEDYRVAGDPAGDGGVSSAPAPDDDA